MNKSFTIASLIETGPTGDHLVFLNSRFFKTDSSSIWINQTRCDGGISKGFATDLATRFPEMYDRYKHDCESRLYIPGNVYLYKDTHPKIINFAVRRNVDDLYKMEYIESGLIALRTMLSNLPGHTVAIPSLGYGLGVNRWPEIRSLIEKHLGEPIPGIERITCYSSVIPCLSKREEKKAAKHD